MEVIDKMNIGIKSEGKSKEEGLKGIVGENVCVGGYI